jgi:hypothetical protein
MAKSTISSDLAKLSKQKVVPAIVTDVLGLLCSVRLSARGTVLHGIKYFGNVPVIGETVYVNYQSGTPIVYTVSSGSGTSVVSSISSPVIGGNSSLEPPITIEDHNHLYDIQGGFVGDEEYAEAEYYHLTEDEYTNLIRGYLIATNKLQLGNINTPWAAEADTIINSSEGRSLGRTGIVFSDTLTHSDYDSTLRGGGTSENPTKVLDGMILKRMQARGYYDNSGNYTERQAEIRFVADGDWSITSQPTRIEFYTTAVDGVTQALALTIGSDGLLYDGNGDPIGRNEISGSFTTTDGKTITITNGLVTSIL